jgi:hypothetical protein
MLGWYKECRIFLFRKIGFGPVAHDLVKGVFNAPLYADRCLVSDITRNGV